MGAAPCCPAFALTVAEALAEFFKPHPQDGTSTTTPGQGPAVEAQKTNQPTGGRGSRGSAHSQPAQLPVSCNVKWIAVSDPWSQPMCAQVLAGFLRSHFQDNLCTVLDKYVRVEVSFAHLKVREEARALVEHGGSITPTGCRVPWQKWTPYIDRAKGGTANRTSSGRPGLQPAPGGGSRALVLSAATTDTADGAQDLEHKRNKRLCLEAQERSLSPSREHQHRRHGRSRRSRS